MKDKLNIIWTTTDADTVFHFLSMYAINSLKNHWWRSINVIIWGASSKFIIDNLKVQTEVIEMIQQGVHIEACKSCSDNLEVTDALIKLGVEVKYMGEILTDYIKNDEHIITI